MKNQESSEETSYIKKIKILDVEKRTKSRSKYYAFVIQAEWANPDNTFIIYRSYAQFFDLQCKLLDLFAETQKRSSESTSTFRIPRLPEKVRFGRSQVRQIALERQQTLDEYCQKLISLPKCVSQSRRVLEFFSPTATDVQKPAESLTNEDFSSIITSLLIKFPPKPPTYRCVENFNGVEQNEISLKENDIVEVLDKDESGWWFVQQGDRTGFVAAAFLEPTEPEKNIPQENTLKKSLNEPYVVNQTYVKTKADEISIEEGSLVTVIEKSLTGWWIVKSNETTGRFPSKYLTPREGSHTSEDTLDNPSSTTDNAEKSEYFNDSDWDDDDEYTVESSNDTKPELYYVHTDFTSHVEESSSLQRGDLLEIHDKNSNGWWQGKRVNDGQYLTWIPATYLQKEPISDDTSIDTNEQSKECEIYSNIPPTVIDSSVDQQKEKQENLPLDTENESLQIPTSNEFSCSQVVTTLPTREEETVYENSPELTPSLPINNTSGVHSKPKSVKDLVKKFNQFTT